MQQRKRLLLIGILLILLFIIWTLLVKLVDVQPLGVNGTNIGFATINTWFHNLTGVHMKIYIITDWLELIPIATCLIFGILGTIQLFKRKSLLKVDYDILILGIYYILVIIGYIIFEIIEINYRPILINGVCEPSYPSSTTLLILCVMPTLIEQINRRLKNSIIKSIIKSFVIYFSIFMVCGRLISGVHWLTDIIGSIIISFGLFCIYKSFILLCYKKDY
jgi:undecaprenyl-diphosphatase